MNIRYGSYHCVINDEKRYHLPNDIKKIEYAGYYIYISPRNGSWIVIENAIQEGVFNSIYSGLSVREVVEKYLNESQNVEYVLAQIEGKHLEHRLSHEEEYEFNLRIYLTNKCNLRCVHCFMYANEGLENELTKKEVVELIDSCANAGATKLILTGGEVSISDTFIEALTIAKKRGMYTQVLTNGTAWSEKLLRETIQLIDEIQVSIDGFNEKVNSEIRGKDVFEKALKTVDIFVNAGVRTSIVVTPLYGYVEKYYQEYLEFSRKLVDKYDGKDFLVIYGNELIDGRDVTVSEENNNKYAKTIKMLCEDIYENNELTAFVVSHEYNKIFKNCGYGGLTVNSNGDFYFCGRVSDVKKYGNIRTTSFDEIMQLRKQARRISGVDYFYPCQTCEVRYVCGGGCRVSNFNAITQREDLLDESFPTVKHIGCTDSYKKNIYKLMIEANDFLLW